MKVFLDSNDSVKYFFTLNKEFPNGKLQRITGIPFNISNYVLIYVWHVIILSYSKEIPKNLNLYLRKVTFPLIPQFWSNLSKLLLTYYKHK